MAFESGLAAAASAVAAAASAAVAVWACNTHRQVRDEPEYTDRNVDDISHVPATPWEVS